MAQTTTRFVALVLSLWLLGCASQVVIHSPAQLTNIEQKIRYSKLWESKLDWHHLRPEPFGFEVAFDKENIYLSDNDQSLYAFRLLSGKKVWSIKFNQKISSAVYFYKDILFVTTVDGHLIGIDPKSYKKVMYKNIEKLVNAPIVSDQEQLYLRTNDQKIFAYKPLQDKEVWSHYHDSTQINVAGQSAPVLWDDKLILASDGGLISGLDLTGKLLWEQRVYFPSGSNVIEKLADTAITHDQDSLYTNTLNGPISKINIRSEGAQIIWQKNLSTPYLVKPFDNKLIVVDQSDKVRALDKQDGKTIWRNSQLRYRRLTAPLVVNQLIVVADYQGFLHFLDPQKGSIIGRVMVSKNPIIRTWKKGKVVFTLDQKGFVSASIALTK